uniref:Uncharacterized protein n=1 Tax=Corvus moneduloides TaxID=1196302 RepID=A0A8U7N7W8_CORMO
MLQFECRSPVGLDCCSCCLDLANRSGLEEGAGGENNNRGQPHREQLPAAAGAAGPTEPQHRQAELHHSARTPWSPSCGTPATVFNQGICNRNIDQTLLSILLLSTSPSASSCPFGSSPGPPGVETGLARVVLPIPGKCLSALPELGLGAALGRLPVPLQPGVLGAAPIHSLAD